MKIKTQNQTIVIGRKKKKTVVAGGKSVLPHSTPHQTNTNNVIG